MSAPKAPQGLGEHGRRLWRDVLADYELSSAELAVLEAACLAYDRLLAAEKVLAAEGMSVNDRYGVPKLHPLTAVVRDASTLMARCLRQLDVKLDDEAPRPPRTGAKPGARPKPARPLRGVS